MAGEGELNLDTVTLENAATGATRAFHWLNDAVAPGSALVLFIGITVLCCLWRRRDSKNSNLSVLSISGWPQGIKVALFPLITAFALTHAFSAGSVYYNTNIASASTEQYFQELGIGRLLSLSHAHLFAHAAMYFLMAFLVQLTGASRLFTVWAPQAALWAGIFDVVSWWGLKKVSPSFEVLSAVCGSSFSIAFLLMSYAILRAAWRTSDAPEHFIK